MRCLQPVVAERKYAAGRLIDQRELFRKHPSGHPRERLPDEDRARIAGGGAEARREYRRQLEDTSADRLKARGLDSRRNAKGRGENSGRHDERGTQNQQSTISSHQYLRTV